MEELNPIKTPQIDLQNSVEPASVFSNFKNEKQKEIYQALLGLSETAGLRLGGIYAGIVRTLSDKGHPDRLSQAAQSIRELANLIPRFKEGIILPEPTNKLESVLNKANWNALRLLIGVQVSKPIPQDIETVIESVASILNRSNNSDIIADQLVGSHPDRSELPAYLQKGFVKEWVRLQRWFTSLSHYPDVKNSTELVSDNEFEKNFLFFEDLLYRTICHIPFFQPLPEIDKLLKLERPTQEDVQSLARIISHPKQKEYFFNQCSNPEWISPLNKSGAFSRPQEPLRENGGVMFVPWPESKYLARMASQKPKEVFDIVQGLESDNQTVLYDFVDCALKSPLNIAIKYVDLVDRKKWLNSPYSLSLPNQVAELMEMLAEGGRVKEALRLARVLFNLQVDPPIKTSEDESDPLYRIQRDARPYYDEWNFSEIIKRKSSTLVKADPVGAFGLFSSILRQAIELEGKVNKEEDSFYEYSHIWRPNLEQSRNTSTDSKNCLLTRIIELIKEYKDEDDILQGFLGVIQKHNKYALFRRVEMYLYNLRLDLFQKEAEEILADKKVIVSYNLRREYLPLLASRFDSLSDEAKEKIMEAIKVGPNFTKSEHMSEEQFVAIQEDWYGLYVANIKDFLPSDMVKKYEDIVARRGEIKDHDGEIKTWEGGNESPITVEDFIVLNHADAIDFLNKYKSPDDFTSHHGVYGLGSVFAKAVNEQPEKYVDITKLFLKDSLRPVYVYHFISGIKDAMRNNKDFDWVPVIEFFYDLVVTHKEDDQLAEANPHEQDWKSVKMSTADLLGTVLGGGLKNEIPISLRPKVWDILKVLGNDPDPTKEYEEKQLATTFDPIGVAVNSIRGEAINAMVNYGLWVIRLNTSSEPHMTPELAEELNNHLDTHVDSSLAVRSVYGRRIPNLIFLSKEWVKNKKDEIFPDKSSPDQFKAAFVALISNQVYSDVFNLLKDKYSAAIALLDSEKDTKYRSVDINERLPHHLIIIYINYPEHDDLIDNFFLNAPVTARAQAIGFVGRNALSDIQAFEKDKYKLAKNRLITLWQRRIKAQKDALTTSEELKEFGWWFENSPFDKKVTISLMLETLDATKGEIDGAYQIVETLEGYVPDFPLESIKILKLLVNAEKDYEISYKMDSYKAIIRKAKESGDSIAADVADEVINDLGAKGFIDLRNLL